MNPILVQQMAQHRIDTFDPRGRGEPPRRARQRRDGDRSAGTSSS